MKDWQMFVILALMAFVSGVMVGGMYVYHKFDKEHTKVVQCRYEVDIHSNPRKVCE